MANINTDFRLTTKDKLEFAASIVWLCIVWGLMLTAAFMVGPAMGFAMIGTIAFLWIRNRIR